MGLRLLPASTLALAFLLCACSGQQARSVTSPTPAINCGSPSALTSDPRDPALKGVVVGPVMFAGFDSGSGTAVISGFNAAAPTKVLIQPIAPLSQAVRLEGFRCSTGERLRLDYGASRNTFVAALLPAGSDSSGRVVGYSGDMRFTAKGKWLISVSTKVGHLIGSAIFSVQ